MADGEVSGLIGVDRGQLETLYSALWSTNECSESRAAAAKVGA